MDPKVCGKLLTTHRRGLGDDVERRRRLQDGISRIQKVAAVEIVFCGAPGCFLGTWIYIGVRSRSVELRGAHEGGGAPRGAGVLGNIVILKFSYAHARSW